jgi:hypothetical protein
VVMKITIKSISFRLKLTCSPPAASSLSPPFSSELSVLTKLFKRKTVNNRILFKLKIGLSQITLPDSGYVECWLASSTSNKNAKYSQRPQNYSTNVKSFSTKKLNSDIHIGQILQEVGTTFSTFVMSLCFHNETCALLLTKFSNAVFSETIANTSSPYD